jgi:hypothetical protein
MITMSVAQSGETSIQTQYALHDGQIRACLLTGRSDNIQLEFQSRTHLPNEANLINTRVIGALSEIAEAAGMPLKIVGANFAFNSYPRHVIEVRVIHEAAPAAKGPSPWLAFIVVAMTMMFEGLSAIHPLFDTPEIQPPPPQVEKIIEFHHQEIATLIIPQTMVISKGGLPLTTWEDGHVVLFTPPQLLLR